MTPKKPITRRQFIRLAALTLAAVPVACTSDPDTKIDGESSTTPHDITSETASTQTTTSATPSNEATVIIIGAGMAGLAAAYQLKNEGISDIIILEARDRLGGRIFTDRSLGLPVDMGASWIHGPQGNPLTPLAQAAGATTFLTDDENVEHYDNQGNLISEEILEAAYERYVELLEAVDYEDDENQSLAQAIQEIDASHLTDPLMLYQLSAYTEFSAGGSIEKLSAAQWDEDDTFDGRDLLFPNGYDTLIDHLAQGLDIRRNHIVTTISNDETGADIETNQGTFSADYCICTLPIGVLQHGDIDFDPPLPNAFQNAINAIGLGHVNKVALQFPETFWDNNLQYVGYTAPQKGQYPYIMNVNTFAPHSNMLMTFALGDYGLTAEAHNDSQITQEIMAMLYNIYGDEINKPDALLVSRWTQDPYSRCSYSFAQVGTKPSHFSQFEEAIAERLLFAGEHTSVDYRGTVHGAYLSGQRAANAIIQAER